MNVKNTLILLILYLSITNFGHAFDIDETVDDEIRKKYNSSQLIEDVGIKNKALETKIQSIPNSPDPNLPELPSILKTKEHTVNTDTKPNINYTPYRGGNIKVSSGKTFNVISTSTISDWQRKGTKITFSLPKATHGKGYSIPAGTIFTGEIIESHTPQISCNGGLIALKIHTMNYKGQIWHRVNTE